MNVWFRRSLAVGGFSFASLAAWTTMDRYLVTPNPFIQFKDCSLVNFNTIYSDLLSSHVTNGQVNYDALSKDPLLEQCIAYAQCLGPNSCPEQFETDKNILAYYINLYNLFTMYNVIYHSKRLPQSASEPDSQSSSQQDSYLNLISSVMDVDSPLYIIDRIKAARGYGFFITSLFKMDGEYNSKVSLDHLENKKIRSFKDARIHTAINCASKSCPKLQSFVFGYDSQTRQIDKVIKKTGGDGDNDGEVVETTGILDGQLDQCCAEFVNSPFHVNFSFKTRKIYLSKIFEWYKQDFEECDDYTEIVNDKPQLSGVSGELKFIYKYGNEETKQKLLRMIDQGGFKVLYNEYDWGLNSLNVNTAPSEQSKL